MSRTYRQVPPDIVAWAREYDGWDDTVTWLSRDHSCRAHRGTTRCTCQYPRDRWHRKRERRMMRSGATPREVRQRVGW